MSLYGGIRLKGAPKPSADATAAPAAAAAPPPSETPSPAPTATDDKPKPAAWSAALRFAPTARRKPAAPSSRTPAAALLSAFGAVEDDASSDAALAGAAAPRIAKVGKASLTAAPDKAPPPSKWSAVTRTATVVEPFASTDGNSGRSTPVRTATSTTTSTRVRRVIAVPPAMTLDDDVGGDVNGFAQTAAGKKAAQMEKKRNKKRGKARDDPALAFADVPYDPARPCDYSAYKTHVKLAREQRRLEREEEERRRRREGSASGSSYYSEDDERSKENEPANKKARFFAPPASYDGAGPSGFPPAMSNPAAARREETGDEAYQRRVAMSQRREETGDEAYQRRFALSRGGPAPPVPAAPPPAFVSQSTFSAPPAAPPVFVGPVLPPGFAAALPPPPPGFVPPPAGFVLPGFSPATATGDAPPFRPPSASASASPAPSLAPEQAAHAASAPAPAPAPPSSEALDAAQARAREIAARLSKLGGAFAAPPPGFAPAAIGAGGSAGPSRAGPPAEPDDRTFAERMMSKFGWEEGKGLGAAESGMTSALSVERAAAPPSKKQKKKAAAEGAPPPPPAQQGMAARSVVVDATKEERAAAQRAQMGGEASRVVLLTNLCGREEVDDDLPGEVAEEANRFGVVERCFVYPVPGEARDDEAVRIFLVMSGLAGGYNAVKNFDGRFFGGRTVRARFYDEKAFNAGRHNL